MIICQSMAMLKRMGFNAFVSISVLYLKLIPESQRINLVLFTIDDNGQV